MGTLSYNDKQCMQTLREQGLGAKAIISSYPDKEWKLSTVKKVCSALAQQFCANQPVELGSLPQRLHAHFVVRKQFSHW